MLPLNPRRGAMERPARVGEQSLDPRGGPFPIHQCICSATAGHRRDALRATPKTPAPHPLRHGYFSTRQDTCQVEMHPLPVRDA